jgi:hypothetical protein
MGESVKSLRYLSLSEAIKTGRIQDFITQEEARGIGSADQRRLDRVIKKAIKDGQSEDRTSRSRSGGD